MFGTRGEVQPEVLSLGKFHKRPLVAEPASVTAFEQMEKRPAVVTLHQLRFEKLNDHGQRSFFMNCFQRFQSAGAHCGKCSSHQRQQDSTEHVACEQCRIQRKRDAVLDDSLE